MTYDLTTLESAKAAMRISDNGDDSLISSLITAVSNRIQRMAGRRFAVEEYREWRPAGRGGGHELRLRHWPIVAVRRVACGRAAVVEVTAAGHLAASVEAVADAVHLSYVDAAGAAQLETIAYAGAATTALLAAAISAVEGYAATALADVPAAMLRATAGQDCLAGPARLTWADRPLRCGVDADRGMLTLPADWTGPGLFGCDVYVEYRAGYEIIPADLAMLTKEMVQELYERLKANPALGQESLGDYSRVLADGLNMQEAQRAALARYMEVR